MSNFSRVLGDRPSIPLISTAVSAMKSSVARTLRMLSMISRACLDPIVPIDTCSSWFADDGMESTLAGDRKSTRLHSSHVSISYAVFCLKKKTDLHDVHVSH